MSVSRALALCAACALALSGAGCKKPAQGAQEEAEKRKTVRVETIGRADIAEVLRYVADLQPFTEVKVASPLPERILSFPWKDGQTIRRGQRVALIRRESMDKGLEGLEAQIQSLDAQISGLETELKRSKDLLAAGVITQAVFDKVQTSYLSLQGQRRALVASRDQLVVTANNALLTAPITGVIADKMLEVGDMAVPQVPLCRILQIDRLKVRLRLVEADVPKVRRDQEVRLTLDAWPDRTFTGKVTTILPYMDAASRTNTVEVTVDNPVDEQRKERLLKPGMYGRAELVVDRREAVLVAPEPALLLDNQLLERQKADEVLRKAYVVDDRGIAHRREVRLGARQGSLLEVVDGLAEGERVVVRGQHELRDGQEVEVVEDKAE